MIDFLAFMAFVAFVVFLIGGTAAFLSAEDREYERQRGRGND